MVHEIGFEGGYAVEIINFKIADTGDGAKDIPNMAHLHSPSVVSRLRLNLHVSKVSLITTATESTNLFNTPMHICKLRRPHKLLMSQPQ